MGRTSTFSDQQVFSAVSSQIADGGDFKIQDLAHSTSVSIGSLYHRYASREGLLAAAWLDALLSSHTAFLTALDAPGRDAGQLAALATPKFARQHRDKAVILCLGRHETLLSKNAPKEFLEKAKEANSKVKHALEVFAQREHLSMQACMHGIVAFPLAAVKLYLPHNRVPKSVDAFVKAAYQSAIQVGNARPYD